MSTDEKFSEYNKRQNQQLALQPYARAPTININFDSEFANRFSPYNNEQMESKNAAILAATERAHKAEMKSKEMELQMMKMQLQQNQFLQQQMIQMMQAMQHGSGPTNLTQKTITFTSTQTQIQE